MSSDLDVPNLPFPKPKSLERLEKILPEQWNAMDEVEIKEHIQNAADGIATAYRKSGGRDFIKCLAIITAALSEMGNALGGDAGSLMVGLADQAANQACHTIFPEEGLLP